MQYHERSYVAVWVNVKFSLMIYKRARTIAPEFIRRREWRALGGRPNSSFRGAIAYPQD